MARPIDEKIVAMKMDNSDFKRKAVETTNLFGKLRDSLNRIPGVNLGKVSNDLGNIQKAANGTNMSGLARSVDAIAGKFSALGIIATTALVNISNKAVDAGMRLADSLGMQQLRSGFQEYEQKMGSIQTILANTQSKGSTLGDVKNALEELNLYADRTIYSFADMTKNIGLFTNAGLGLEESTSMIKGFSNAAAASGTNAEKAANAAYQLSQGLSSGYLMQMDWMSLTNAGMGNDNMKRDLIALGQAMGTLEDHYTTTEVLTDWKNLLSDEKWLTSGVMSNYLQTMAGDIDKATLLTLGLTEAQADLMLQNAQTGLESATMVRTFTQMLDTLKEGIGSGWSTTWELIFGDFEEATRLWTAVSELIGGVFEKQSDARNNMLRSLIAGDAITNIISGLMNVTKPIVQVFRAIGAGFKIAFPSTGLSGIENLVSGFRNLTSGLKFSEKTVQSITTIFTGFFSVFAIGWDIVKGAVSVILALLPSFEGLGSKILELIARVAQIPIAFNNASGSGESFGSAMEVLKKIASNVATALEYIVGGLITFADTAAMAFGVLSKGEVSDGPWKDTKIVDWLMKIREGFSSFGNAIGSINWSAIGAGFVDFFGSIKSGFEWIMDKASAVGTSIKNAMPDGTQLLQGGFIAGMVAMVGMAVKMGWDIYEMFTGWGKIGAGVSETLEGVGGALESFAWQVKAQALLTIAIAVGVLAGSFFVLSRLKAGDITKGLYAIVGGLSAIVIAMAVMTKFDITGTGMLAAIQIVALSIAFAILAGAMKKMAGLDWNQLGKGIVGLIGIMGTFSLAMIAMSKFSGPGVAASALQFVGLAIAMHILISAITKISDISPSVLIKGVATIGAILLALGVFLAISSKSKFGAASALGILGIATAILIIVNAVKSLGGMDTNVLKQGLLTITLILAAISAFSIVTVGLLASGAGILLLAVALNLLMVPIFALGSMDMLTLAKGLGAMAIALVAIGAASMLMTGMIAAGAGLILMAAGLNLLLVPILALSALSWGALTIGIVGLAGGILLIGGAAALLGLAGPALLLGAAGIAALGIAMLAAGLGVSLFGAGLVALAGLTGTAITTIVAMLGTLIMGLVSLIPTFVDFMSKLFIRIAEAIDTHMPVLITKMYDTAIKIINVFTEKVPEFAKAATNLIVAFINSMAEQQPRVVDSAANLMVATVEALAVAVETNGPKFTDAFRRLMTEVSVLIIESGIIMIQSLFGWIPGVTDATNEIGRTAEENIRGSFDAEGAGVDKGTDFNSSLASTSEGAKTAGTTVGTAGEDGVGSADLSTIGSEKGVEFASALGDTSEGATTAGTTIATAGKTGAGSVDMTSTGTNFGQGFANGISSGGIMSNVVAAASSLASAAMSAIKRKLDINSPSKETTKLGNNAGTSFATGIASTKAKTEKSANSIAGLIMNALGVKSAPAKEASKGGKTTGENFAKGISSSKAKSSKASKSVGKSAGTNFAKGISSSKAKTAKASKSVGKSAATSASKGFNEAMDAAEHKFKMGKINSTQYIAELEKIKRAYSKQPAHVRKVEAEIKKVQEDAEKHKADLRAKGLSKAKELLDEQKYYNRITLKGELDAWVKLQAKYKSGTAERKEADREVFRLRQALIKEEFDLSKKVIDDKKYYNDISLTEELAAWEKIQSKYKIGTEERKEADREVYRLKNDINQRLIDMNNEYVDRIKDANKKLLDDEKQLTEERDKLIKEATDNQIAEERRLTDELDKSIKDRTKSLVDYAGIFDKVEKKKGVSGSKLLSNLKGQVDTFAKWSTNIDTLSTRGMDEELITELREMGPKAATEIAALNTLTDEQLTEYSGIWKTKNEQARVESNKQMETMRKDTYSKIEELKQQTADQLATYNREWSDKTEELRAQTATQLDGFKADWLAKIEELSKGTKDKFVALGTDMKTIGVDTIQGMMDGMKSMEGPLMAQVKAMADSIASTIASSLAIKSPSRVTRAQGQYTGEGLVLGLADKIQAVKSKSKQLALASRDTLNTFLEGISLPEDDMEIRIKAVVEWDGLNLNNLNSKLSRIQPDVSYTTGSVRDVKSTQRQNDNNHIRTADKEPQVVTKEVKIDQHLSFHTKEMSPSEVARKNLQASRQLAMQWGV